MTIAVILIVFICSFIIVHHLYKVKDKLDEQFKDLRYHQNHISQSIGRIEQSLYQIDDCVEDIEDKVDGAKWADETMIEKACEWISQSYTSGVLDWKNCDSIIEDFKKAMEG